MRIFCAFMRLDVDARILVGLRGRPGASLFSQAKQKRGTHTRLGGHNIGLR